ncbi:MAG TPA: class I SAM-dependent methyltransferase [Anaerolineales bacterium]|nr:class I SAM-dependent methyltransferase [Anaerolineales bacterium]
MWLADLFRLYTLARRRLRSEDDYKRFQAFQARLLLQYLRRYRVQLPGKLVLDLGSGIGGYSEVLAATGARVYSLDLIAQQQLSLGCGAIKGNALSIPLKDGSMDFIFCASLIEHVPDPGKLITEIRRVLAPGGLCYLSFPPYYSPLGGHEFSPFHYLGERWALRLNRRKRDIAWGMEYYKLNLTPRSFKELFEDWGLYKMTVSKAMRLVRGSGLRLVNLSTRYFPISLVRWPILGEIFTWHAQFLLEKPAR